MLASRSLLRGEIVPLLPDIEPTPAVGDQLPLGLGDDAEETSTGGKLSRAQLAEWEKGFGAIPSKRRQRLDYTYNIPPQDPRRAGDCG